MVHPQPCCTYKLINAHLIVFLNYKNVIMYLVLKLVILIFSCTFLISWDVSINICYCDVQSMILWQNILSMVKSCVIPGHHTVPFIRTLTSVSVVYSLAYWRVFQSFINLMLKKNVNFQSKGTDISEWDFKCVSPFKLNRSSIIWNTGLLSSGTFFSSQLFTKSVCM